MDDPVSLRRRLASANPLFGLSVRTPRLTLEMPVDPDLLELLGVIDGGIHDRSWMPFNNPWTDTPMPQRDRESLAHWWRLRALWSPDDWTWCGAVRVDGELVGVQDLMGREFPALQEVSTGSWLGMRYQGHGLGKEMRAAILHLAFEGLGARRAHSGYLDGNEASKRVSDSFGYEFNGIRSGVNRDSVRREVHVVLEREVWMRTRRDDIDIVGLESCRDLFGA